MYCMGDFACHNINILIPNEHESCTCHDLYCCWSMNWACAGVLLTSVGLVSLWCSKLVMGLEKSGSKLLTNRFKYSHDLTWLLLTNCLPAMVFKSSVEWPDMPHLLTSNVCAQVCADRLLLTSTITDGRPLATRAITVWECVQKLNAPTPYSPAHSCACLHNRIQQRIMQDMICF